MTDKNEHLHAEIAMKLNDTELVTKALKQAAQNAILQHARAGVRLSFGETVWSSTKLSNLIDEPEFCCATDLIRLTMSFITKPAR